MRFQCFRRMKKMVKRFFACLVCLFLAASLVSVPAFSAEKVSIEMWHAMKAEKKDAIDGLVAKFMKENPGITVTAKQFVSPDYRSCGNDYSYLYKNIIQGIAGSNPPDVAQVYENWTTQFVEIGVITPFSHFKGSDALPKSEIDDIFPIFRDPCIYDGSMWTMPFNKSIYVLYYNKAVFSKLGLKPPKTWEEMRSACKRIYESEGFPGVTFVPSVDMMGHTLYSNGGSFIVGDKAAFNDKTGFDSLNYWVDMVANNYASYSFKAYGDFLDGKAGMFIETTSRIGSLNKSCRFDYGIAFVPTGKSRLYQCAGTNLAIFSKDEAKKLAAWKLIRFFARKDNNVDLSIKTGYLPTRSSAYLSPEYQKYITDHPGYKIGVDALKYGVSQPRTSAWESVRGFVSDAVFDAVSGNVTTEEAIDRSFENSSDLLKGFK